MNESGLNNRKNYDYVGIALSILCGIHCLITPLLIIYLPVIGKAIESTWFHTGMIFFIIFIFHQTIYKHFKQHKSKLILGLASSGIILFLVSYINEIMHHSGEHEGGGDHHSHGHGHLEVHSDETAMIYIAILGAILLVTAHILNIKKCKCFNGQDLCNKKD